MRLALAATLALLAVPALAQDATVYTGCIRSADGTLYNVSMGSDPKAPCKARETQITWNKAGVPGTPLPPSLEIDVNCPTESINTALAYPAESITISISGTCSEAVVINRDHVTLQSKTLSSPPILTHEATPVTVLSARDITLYNLEISGNAGVLVDNSQVKLALCDITSATHGVQVNNLSFADVSDSTIHDNAWDGFSVRNGSVLQIRSTHVENNGSGIVGTASTLDITYGTINNNGLGINFGRGSAVYLELSDVSWNTNEGIAAGGASSVFIWNSTLTHNGYAGVACEGSCSLGLREGTTISNNSYGIVLKGGSNLSIGGDNVMTRNDRGIWAVFSSFSAGTLQISGNRSGIVCEGSSGDCTSSNITDSVVGCGPMCPNR